jgi:hypothetical protein
MKNSILLFILVVITGNFYAQRNITLADLKTPYTYRVNPAVMPESKFFISFLPLLGSQNFQFTNRIAAINEVFVPDASGDSLVLNSSESFYNRMGKKTYLGLEMTNQIFAFGFKVKKNYFTLDISNRLNVELGLGSDLLKFLSQGNGSDLLLGKRASFDGLGPSLLSYIEYGLGYTRNVNDKLSVGGRLKLLSGLANLKGSIPKFGIKTDASDYSLTIDGEVDLKSSNTAIFSDSAYMNSLDYMRLAKMAYNFSNLGLGIDLGGTYKLLDNVVLKASVIDLGFIKWTQGIANYQVKPFSYKFSGININDVLKKDNNTDSESLTDSLSSIFKTGKSTDSYTTGLPTRVYLGGDYIWNKYFTSGVNFYNEFYNSSYRAGLIISSTLSVSHWFGMTLNYGMYAGSFSNVGLGLRLRGFYILTDNLISAINYQATRVASIAFGFNITVGKTKDEKKKDKTKPAKKDTNPDKVTPTNKTITPSENSNTPGTKDKVIETK